MRDGPYVSGAFLDVCQDVIYFCSEVWSDFIAERSHSYCNRAQVLPNRVVKLPRNSSTFFVLQLNDTLAQMS
jgi:hypothetical protein